jgi:hypothetical protein
VRIAEIFVCSRNCCQKIYAFVHSMNLQCVLIRISESTRFLDPRRIRCGSKFRIARPCWRNNYKNGFFAVPSNSTNTIFASAVDSNSVLPPFHVCFHVHCENFYILLHPMNPQCVLKRIRRLLFQRVKLSLR